MTKIIINDIIEQTDMVNIGVSIMSRQYDNPNGRLESNNSCHVQRIGDETTKVEYNSETNNLVSSDIAAHESSAPTNWRSERYAELYPHGELGYQKKEVLEYLCLKNGLLRKDVAKLYNVKECTVKKWISKTGIKLVNKGGIRRNNFNDDYFEVIDTEAKAYFLGFILADGCVRKKKGKNSYSIRIKIHKKDKEILDIFKKEVEFTGPIHNIPKEDCVSIELISKKMFDDLGKYGICPNKTSSVGIPKINQWYSRHMIRGIFDGDGHINKHKLVLATGSNKMVGDFIILGHDMLLNIYLYKVHSSNYKIIFNRRDRDFADYIYGNCTIALSRKLAKYNEFWKRS